MRVLDKAPLHPFLFAVYPVLALLTLNAAEVAPASAVRSLVVSVGLALVLLLSFRVFLRDTPKAAALASLALLLFFAYGHTYVLMRQQPALSTIARHRVLITLEAGVFVAAAIGLARRGLPLMATRLLNATALVAVGLVLVQSTWIFADRGPEPPSDAGVGSGLDLTLPDASHRRDVYYIILDGYTRADVLDGFYDYDNRPFLTELEALGFKVAEESRSNYAMTRLSLPSSLNMDYVDALGPPLEPGGAEPAWLDKVARYSRVRSAFEELGYQIVSFESAIGMTDWPDSDLYMSRKPLALSDAEALWQINPFEILVAQTSMARLIIDGRTVLNRVFHTKVEAPNEQHRERILFALDRLGRMAEVPGPKFVFVHIMSPHQPYVFTAEGEAIGDEGIFTLAGDPTTYDVNSRAAYANQVAFVNSRILPALERLLEDSPAEPIIILQGDHGGAEVSSEDRMKILNAYYLPDGGSEAIYPAISPVNTFRTIFNRYFGGNLPLLEDRSYFSPVDDPFRLTPIP